MVLSIHPRRWRPGQRKPQPAPAPLTDAQQAIAAKYLNLAHRLLRQHYGYLRHYNHNLWLELRSAAYYGLFLAAAGFKPELGFQFTTYATPVIWGHMKNAARAHLDRVRLQGDPVSPRLFRYHVDPDLACPSVAAISVELHALVADAMRFFTPRDALITKLRFGLCGHAEHTVDETGAALGISRQRVNQIIKYRVLPRLRTILASYDEKAGAA